MVTDKNISADEDVNMFLRGFRAQNDSNSHRDRNYITGVDDDTKQKLNEAATRWMVIPERAEYLYWTIMTTILILYYLIAVPIRVGFGSTTPNNSWVQGDEPWYWMDFMADCIFLVDLAMNFRTIIKIPGGDYITDARVIAKYYVLQSGWFWPDLLASIPTTFIFHPGQESNTRLGRFLV